MVEVGHGLYIEKGRGIGDKKNLQNFNLALLGKWKWRMLTEMDDIWLKVISLRYENAELRGNLFDNLSEASGWGINLVEGFA